LETRSVPNPYQAPRADLEPRSPLLDKDARLASRAQRLGGGLVDILLQLLARTTIYLGVSRHLVTAMSGDVFKLYLRLGPWGYLTGAVVLSLLLVQWSCITQRGQSIGKMAARSRIVRTCGAPVGFLHGVVIRNWILGLPGLLLPLLGVAMEAPQSWALAALALADVLFIFGATKRCFHDLLANTKVIDLSSREIDHGKVLRCRQGRPAPTRDAPARR
jgi:uncharacterized RDD family membrane protein YckC